MEKAIAIIDMPKTCEECIFHFTKWQNPFLDGEKAHTKGISCQLDMNKKVTTLDIDDNVFKPSWCPLKPVEGE